MYVRLRKLAERYVADGESGLLLSLNQINSFNENNPGVMTCPEAIRALWKKPYWSRTHAPRKVPNKKQLWTRSGPTAKTL